MFTLPTNARWSQNGVTVAGGNGRGNAVNQLNFPYGLGIDDHNRSIVIANHMNYRIVECKVSAINGKVIAGGQSQESRLEQLNHPTDVLIDQETNSLFIADRGNRRVLPWSRHQDRTQSEVIVDDIYCFGLAIDHQRYLYVSNIVDEVRRSSSWQSLGVEDHGLRLCFVLVIYLRILRWLMSPILALNVLWQIGQVVSAGSSGFGCCCLSFRFLRFSYSSVHLLSSNTVIPSLMMVLHIFLSKTLCSQLLKSMLHFFMLAFRRSLYLFFFQLLFRLPSFS